MGFMVDRVLATGQLSVSPSTSVLLFAPIIYSLTDAVTMVMDMVVT